MFQIFQSNSASSVFGFFNKAFRNNMVLISSKLRFLAADFPQMPLGRACAFGLQSLAQTITTAPVDLKKHCLDLSRL
jgi:hypothetical protein